MTAMDAVVRREHIKALFEGHNQWNLTRATAGPTVPAASLLWGLKDLKPWWPWNSLQPCANTTFVWPPVRLPRVAHEAAKWWKLEGQLGLEPLSWSRTANGSMVRNQCPHHTALSRSRAFRAGGPCLCRSVCGTEWPTRPTHWSGTRWWRCAQDCQLHGSDLVRRCFSRARCRYSPSYKKLS